VNENVEIETDELCEVLKVKSVVVGIDLGGGEPASSRKAGLIPEAGVGVY